MLLVWRWSCCPGKLVVVETRVSLHTLQCVPNDDKSSTHKKALDIFVNKVRGPRACVQA